MTSKSNLATELIGLGHTAWISLYKSKNEKWLLHR